ncbi:MAG: acylphosphatase [Bdellovibrionales bacterium]|nr:acylphosphatase [Bdellovibrionales bacterium]
MTCLRVLIRGRVQGVGFRASTVEAVRAQGNRVRGWVRNLPDGSVEACFCGAPEAVAEILAWCRAGPSHARVDSVETHEGVPPREEGFQVRRDPF